ncbi:hypothetical protein I4J00_05550 [Corynebacterium diphtheriae bv. gravis]|uniref:hypothetical protein n=1 Tax=Corynebacterium diphtheriae TaxID=1717 RepID=UPI000F0D7573|nr:hypothetical protein [Corynebacterium diphtheriae]MBG9296458.1 hypothetical protein [Corynebacterium diphtheriae bv. gravis]RKW87823.1 hypothetical protein D9B36_12120 [Corynebacterium diphtheriae]RLP08654.1 hypothetical protein D9R17_06270 [Corynebacterium diphtheriae]RLP17953.1 hypothetical protein D9R19_05630 [Corynebacterium diphtheriae]UJL53429.1 hypothetical protein FE380_04075 [Corynebacterium diphtheriae]
MRKILFDFENVGAEEKVQRVRLRAPQWRVSDKEGVVITDDWMTPVDAVGDAVEALVHEGDLEIKIGERVWRVHVPAGEDPIKFSDLMVIGEASKNPSAAEQIIKGLEDTSERLADVISRVAEIEATPAPDLGDVARKADLSDLAGRVPSLDAYATLADRVTALETAPAPEPEAPKRGSELELFEIVDGQKVRTEDGDSVSEQIYSTGASFSCVVSESHLMLSLQCYESGPLHALGLTSENSKRLNLPRPIDGLATGFLIRTPLSGGASKVYPVSCVFEGIGGTYLSSQFLRKELSPGEEDYDSVWDLSLNYLH